MSGFTIKPLYIGTFLAQRLDQQPFLKSILHCSRTGALKNNIDGLRSHVSKAYDAFFVEAARDHRAIRQNSNVRRQAMAKTGRAAKRLTWVRPLKTAVKMEVRAAFNVNAFFRPHIPRRVELRFKALPNFIKHPLI